VHVLRAADHGHTVRSLLRDMKRDIKVTQSAASCQGLHVILRVWLIFQAKKEALKLKMAGSL
jgi:hypothetical protein